MVTAAEARMRLAAIGRELASIADELPSIDAVSVYADTDEDGPYCAVKAYRDETVVSKTRVPARQSEGAGARCTGHRKVTITTD